MHLSCLFDENGKLLAMDGKTFNDVHIGKWKWIVYVVEAFITLD